MKITYDAEADAAYIYLSDEVHLPETRQMDEDIILDFNEHNQLVGIEILAASDRLNLSHLLPFVDRLDVEWARLQKELERLKHSGEPIELTEDKIKYDVEEVGHTYVKLRKQESGNTKKVTAMQLMNPHPDEPLFEALRKIGAYKDRKGSPE